MKTEKIILAIDTSLPKISLSILCGEELVGESVGELSSGSSATVLSEISVLLKNNNLTLKEVDVIAVSNGPGSFTGIRIGLATAKALAFGGGQFCIGVSILESMALMTGNSGYIVACVPAGRGQIYRQSFLKTGRLLEAITRPAVADFEEVGEQLTLLNTELDIESRNLEVSIIGTEELIETLRINNFKIEANKRINLQIASDNISKYIGLLAQDILKKERDILDHNHSTIPQYIRNVTTTEIKRNIA